MSMVHFRDKCRVAVVCDSCFDEITSSNRIRCMECKEDECLGCFTASCFNKVHDSHVFKVIRPAKYQKEHEKWSLISNYMFFEGLKLCGIGNWEDLSLFIYSATEKEVERHFFELFSIKALPENRIENISKFSNPNFHDVWCYMPLRQDFEMQFRDDFEKIIKDIRLSEEDDIDMDVKIQMFEMYRTILVTRAYRESFLIKRKIFEMNKLREKERRYDHMQLNILSFYKPLATILSQNDFNAFVYGCFIEAKLRKVINRDIFPLTECEMNLCLHTGMSYRMFRKIRRHVINLMVKKKKLVLEKLIKHLGKKRAIAEQVFSFFTAKYKLV